MRKTIFITGAASGIGRATAHYFVQKGWFAGIADIDKEGIEALADHLGQDNCRPIVLDVTDTEAYMRAMTVFSNETGGRLDLLFNNAGILRMGLNETIDIAQQHRIIDINIKGILNGIHASLPLLKQNSGSRIISMCSTSSVYGTPELAVYSASKAAVRSLTESLDIELEQYNIKVSDILAPYVDTPMVTHADHQATSVGTTGVNLTASQIAALVWKASHSYKLHWKIHYLTYVLMAAFWVMPFIRRTVVKHLCLSK
jgi:NADP-dependent 3-hydroxy acid dehydrogenase YdfG